MAKIATYTSDLPPAEKPPRGSEIITLSTGNNQIPGNATVLAEFTTANTALAAACAQVEVLRGQLREALTARGTAEVNWTAKLNTLASFTLSATGGNAEAIESAGFFVVPPPGPPQPLNAPVNVKVLTNGTPGVSKVIWKPLADAKSYLIQCSPDPITPTSWGNSIPCTKARHETIGATPGATCWFRVCGVNPLGQGPWSEPARRPVM